MKFPKYILSALLILTFNTSHAGYAEDISTCLSDYTSGKDRKDLARWTFTVMATHPEMVKITTINKQDVENIERAAGEVYNRLLTQDCKGQIENAYNNKDLDAIKTAFGQLGMLAMQELITNPNVVKSFAGITKYIDLEKLKPIP